MAIFETYNHSNGRTYSGPLPLQIKPDWKWGETIWCGSHFLQFLVATIGRDGFTEKEKSSLSFLRERIIKHNPGLNFCYYKGSIGAHKEFYNYEMKIESIDGAIKDEKGMLFDYGISWSHRFGMSLFDEESLLDVDSTSSGIWFSHSICDFDDIPQPSILSFPFEMQDFWDKVELQVSRANALYDYLLQEIEREYM